MPPPRPYLAFVAASKGRSVAVVDLGELRLLRFIPLDFSPDRLTLRPHSDELYVTSAAGDIAVVRYPGLRVLATLHTGAGPSSLCFSPDGRRAYAVGPGRRQILVLVGDPPRVFHRYLLKGFASRLAIAADGKTLLVEDARRRKLLFENTENGDPLGSVPLGSDQGEMVIPPGSGKVFIADAKMQAIAAADIRTRQVLSEIEIGSEPDFLVAKPDGGEVIAVSAKSSTLTILDASSDSVEQSLPSGSEPAAAVFSLDSRRLYVANWGDGTVMMIDVDNRAVLASIHVGIQPVALALTPDQRFLAVADAGAASLAIMRARIPMLITTIPVGGDPVDVVVPAWLGAEQPRSPVSAFIQAPQGSPHPFSMSTPMASYHTTNSSLSEMAR
jgi:YVTN family beta-propeller protein